ncbi:hypothetical protein GCM10027174_10360 [Salinifilum aidingensis]
MRDSDPPCDDSEIDPISAMFSAPDHATRQALLPGAVAQAAEMAGKMRATIATWQESTDPGIARLVEHARDSVDMHEQFVARWDGSLVDEASWPILAAELHRLVFTWAHIVETVMPENAE